MIKIMSRDTKNTTTEEAKKEVPPQTADATATSASATAPAAAAESQGLDTIQAKATDARVSDSPVYSFMSKNAVSITEGTKIQYAVQALNVHRVGSAPVVNSQEKIVGVISEHDLLLQSATKDLSEVIDYKKEVMSVTPETPLKEVLVMLYKNKVRRIPVVMKDGTVVGVVTRMDVLLKLIGKAPTN